MIIDTHCHLNEFEYNNLEDILNKLKNENIFCINNSTDLTTALSVINNSKKYSNIFAAIGFHPSEVDKINYDYIEFIEDNIDNIVAIGEIGLDYYWTKDNKEKQKELFEHQLKIAEKYNLPVIIHSRDAINDTYEILKKYNVKGVIHSFSGSLEMAKKFIKLGFKIGIGGVVTFKNCNLKDVVSNLKTTDIVFETDSPYLSPVPFRGKQNNPSNIKYIIDFVANIFDISYQEMCNISFLTATRLFDLKNKIC